MKQNKLFALRIFSSVFIMVLIVGINPLSDDDWVRPRVIETPTNTEILLTD
ncbi:MAG: hypothetical protein FWF59_13285 [Turicibacter sp.]|nr:hypothetical protein [Turicibacter sp.]